MSASTRYQGPIAVMAVAALALVTLFIYAWFDDATHRTRPDRNGDMLGQQTNESLSEYAQRASETLHLAPAEEDAFALVTFARPVSAAEAGNLTQQINRVSAMVVGMAAPIAVPEPVDGASRAQVYQQHLDRLAQPAPDRLTAVITYDTGQAHRELIDEPRVATVEVLPPDAAWNQFGIRPVEVPVQ